MNQYPTPLVVPSDRPPITPDEASLHGQVENLQRIQENQATQIRLLMSNVDSFSARLMEALDNSEIDSDLAKEFADIFDLEMTKEYSVTITASWSGTVTVPFGEDIDDFEVNIEYPELSYSCSDWSLDVDEDEVDHEVSENF
jgi:hypothetical protein